MNKNFLKKYLEMLVFVNSSQENNRSSHKVDLIYGQIARDIQQTLGIEYSVITKETTGKEEKIEGKYFDKRVDIIIKKGKKIIGGGVAVKNPTNSYLKNKNNYFENMLGETANIRSESYLYFQIIIFPHKIPDWKGKGKLQKINKMDNIDENKLKSYLKLNYDDPNKMSHIPSKTLILIIKNNMDECFSEKTKEEHRSFFIKSNNDKNIELEFKEINFNKKQNALIINNYEDYIKKISHLIKGNF